MSTATHSFIFGSVAAASRYAEDLWCALPSPDACQAKILASAFEAAFGEPFPSAAEAEEFNLRRPHFVACYNGIFGGGTTGFPGEFALANYGVLLFAEIECFKPEIIAELAEKLRALAVEGSPIILIHSAELSHIPATLASLPWPHVHLD